MFDLTGKTALVTGAASGIGEIIARTLASAGASVYLADVDRENGEKIVHEIVSDGGVAEFIPLDVSNNENCLAAADAVHAAHAQLDILVNNAGIGHVGT